MRNGPTVVPLELTAGLVEGATPALGYSVTLGYAQSELRGYVESMEAAHRCLPSRSSLERMAKAIGSEALKEAPRIEAVLRRTERVPDEACAISMGLDRTAVPMEEDRPEAAPPKTSRKERTKPYERAKPDPVDVNYRMAYVGTVSLVDEDTEELVTRRYTALPDAEPDDVVKRMMQDVKNAVRQNGALKLVVVQDGAPEMWNATTRGLEKEGLKKWEEAIDRYHLNERLAGALLMVEPEPAARRRKMSEWNDDLDASDEAIDRIQNWLGEQVDKVKDREVEEKYLGKAEIRELSARLGLPTADKPQMACLSSRIPYGEPVTPEKLRMIEAAEGVLRKQEFYDVRVRHHELTVGSLARIEVGPRELNRFFADGLCERIAAELKAIGYTHVTLDLQGYRRGSTNEVLLAKVNGANSA